MQQTPAMIGVNPLKLPGFLKTLQINMVLSSSVSQLYQTKSDKTNITPAVTLFSSLLNSGIFFCFIHSFADLPVCVYNMILNDFFPSAS